MKEKYSSLQYKQNNIEQKIRECLEKQQPTKTNDDGNKCPLMTYDEFTQREYAVCPFGEYDNDVWYCTKKNE